MSLEILISLCFGVSISSLVVWMYGRRGGQKISESRLVGDPAGMSGVIPITGPGIKNEFFQEEKKDRISLYLYAAGLRTKKQIGFIWLIIKVGIVAPVVLIGVNILGNTASTESIFRALYAGGSFCIIAFLFVRMTKLGREKRLLREMPQFVDLIVVCVEAGLGFTSALEKVIAESDPKQLLTKEFTQLHAEYISGLSLSEACKRMDRRCGLPELSVFLGLVIQSDQMGSSLGDSLRVQSEEMRDKYRQRLRAKALKIPIKILFPTMLIFVTIFVVALGPSFLKLKSQMGALVPTNSAGRA